MEFKLTTETIQYLTMALIFSNHEDFMSKEERKRIDEKLTELNWMCNKENNYTLTITVKG